MLDFLLGQFPLPRKITKSYESSVNSETSSHQHVKLGKSQFHILWLFPLMFPPPLLHIFVHHFPCLLWNGFFYKEIETNKPNVSAYCFQKNKEHDSCMPKTSFLGELSPTISINVRSFEDMQPKQNHIFMLFASRKSLQKIRRNAESPLLWSSNFLKLKWDLPGSFPSKWGTSS